MLIIKVKIQLKGDFTMPNLSAKELTALSEQLGLEQMLISKFNCASECTNDAQLKEKFSSIAQKHQNHFNQLKTFLG